MNKENALLYLPLIQALADGKIIQHKHKRDGWMDLEDHVIIGFDDKPQNYRIKPEPRIWKIYIDPSGQIVDGYDYNYARDQGWERITVQEVLE
jgi:hypothetical protein